MMDTGATDRTVGSHNVPIAVRDYGGDGPPVLLLHGAGGNLEAWSAVAPMLAEHHRAVAVDLRGHGESGDGPWSRDAVCEDLQVVVEELDLGAPAVVGHSLGGAIAARWAQLHPECPAVVNLDGHRSPVTAPDRHDADAAGLRATELNEAVARLSAQFDAQAEAMAAALPDDQVESMVEGQRALAAQYGADPDLMEAMTRRGLERRAGGTFVRPGPGITRALREDAQADSVPGFFDVRAPYLLVIATRSLVEVPPDLEPLMVALRAGLRRDLDDLVAARPNIEVREFDASHAVLFEQPREVADLIKTFIGAPER